MSLSQKTTSHDLIFSDTHYWWCLVPPTMSVRSSSVTSSRTNICPFVISRILPIPTNTLCPLIECSLVNSLSGVYSGKIGILWFPSTFYTLTNLNPLYCITRLKRLLFMEGKDEWESIIGRENRMGLFILCKCTRNSMDFRDQLVQSPIVPFNIQSTYILHTPSLPIRQDVPTDLSTDLWRIRHSDGK